MSAEALITALKKLRSLHESLYQLALKKTDLLVNNEMEALQQIVADEQQHIKAIDILEKERQQAAKDFLGREENITISDCIDAAPPEMAASLSELKESIVDTVTQLQKKNELNQSLVFQSLQLVNFSLDLLRPQEQKATYGRPDQQQRKSSLRGLFDSKA
ncbi:flagellar protein FlgN [Bacillus chungangensis]|uniref:Flagellar biosynthesis/type III secretory pathway chaperone n=1 Tax=Bacillus chungangensis TaxID=587633 RepID=A0ABT9WUW5_9BACI|nr:flagellar protein FlgN [Bacillus chungangensis]MDQ0177088.1 flagellar biosynthesis/type III secretory pathway chaperone [Bacillus chungangensis]